MEQSELLSELTIDDLQEQHRRLAEKIGIDTLITMSRTMGGTQQYVPMVFELTKGLICRKIREEFTGDNVRELAVKYGVSESTARRLLQEQIAKKRQGPFDGQVSLLQEETAQCQ